MHFFFVKLISGESKSRGEVACVYNVAACHIFPPHIAAHSATAIIKYLFALCVLLWFMSCLLPIVIACLSHVSWLFSPVFNLSFDESLFSSPCNYSIVAKNTLICTSHHEAFDSVIAFACLSSHCLFIAWPLLESWPYLWITSRFCLLLFIRHQTSALVSCTCIVTKKKW